MSAVEEKKYAQLTRESIISLADSGGFYGISDSVAGLLAEDVNYRLREIVQKASHLMRHSKRRKLNSEDFNRALRLSNVEPVYGYRNPEPLKIVHIKEYDIFAIDDPDINLTTFASDPVVIPRSIETSIKAQWLALEGVLQSSSAAQSSAPSKKNVPTTPTISEHLMAYYDQITKTILGSDEELLKLAFNDLQTNFQIAPLLPYLVNFVSVGVKKMSHDLTQLTKLLQTVSCLVRNKSLYLGTHPYLTLLTQSVLYCILEPLAASINPINDHWTLRDSAAQLLSHILKEWSNPVNNLYTQTVTTLKDSFCDLSKPFSTHYGAAVSIVALGLEEMERLLYPNISLYWPRLVRTLEDCNYNSAQLKADAQKVHGILLSVSELLIRNRQKTELFDNELSEFLEIYDSTPPVEIKRETKPDLKYTVDTTACDSSCAMYLKLYEYFGDAIASRLPCIRVFGMYKPKVETDLSLFTTPELLLTGEELLETFNEGEDDLRSNNSMEDDNSEDENSGMSDDHEAGPIELQIRSTISDPALGIKLTIAKLRPVVKQEEIKPIKKKKMPLKIPKELQEPVFERIAWQSPNGYLAFNFEGGIPLPNLRKCLRSESVDYGANPSTWKVSLKMKKFGKKRFCDKRNLRTLKFNSASLYCVV